MMIPDEEAQQLKAFIKALLGNLRMQYGLAMAELGLDPDTIIDVQQKTAAGMVEWLDRQ